LEAEKNVPLLKVIALGRSGKGFGENEKKGIHPRTIVNPHVPHCKHDLRRWRSLDLSTHQNQGG
jgi:hypothetical protein